MKPFIPEWRNSRGDSMVQLGLKSFIIKLIMAREVNHKQCQLSQNVYLIPGVFKGDIT